MFPKIGVPQKGWFIMESPLKWMIWVCHHFRKHPNRNDKHVDHGFEPDKATNLVEVHFFRVKNINTLTLKLTNSPLQIGPPFKEISSSNHPFSRGPTCNLLFVSGRLLALSSTQHRCWPRPPASQLHWSSSNGMAWRLQRTNAWFNKGNLTVTPRFP